MRTKWKTITLLVIFVLFTNTITFASTSKYYSDMLVSQKEQMQEQLAEDYNKKYKEQGQLNHRDMVTQVEVERVALMERLDHYMDEKIKAEWRGRKGQSVYNELNLSQTQVKLTMIVHYQLAKNP